MSQSSAASTPTGRVVTKAARHQRIIELLSQHAVDSQQQLRDLLADDGFDITQATLSRDLDELRAIKLTDDKGRSVYGVPNDGADPEPRVYGNTAATTKLRRVLAELLTSVDASANIAVIRTPPGAAGYLALAIDHVELPDVLGTVAGDDTVFIVTRESDGGHRVAEQFAQLAGQRRRS